jgi:hypothetical protein
MPTDPVSSFARKATPAYPTAPMKSPRFERLGRLQRQYHRHHAWRLGPGGLYVPHSYAHKRPDELSWWDDVGFIVNGRRVIVWWQHPRHAYENALDEQAWDEVGPGPDDDWLFDGAAKNYRRVGASRKKLVSYTARDPSQALSRHYQALDAARKRLWAQGIELQVRASCRFERLRWATGVSLVAPLEVRNETELAAVADLARRLVRRTVTVGEVFPDYRYGREDWLREQAQTRAQREARGDADGA